MSDEERSPFQSNLFAFKTKRANRIASLFLVWGLGLGFVLSVVSYFVFGGGWFQIIAFGTVSSGLIGMILGYAVGTQIDRERRR